MCHRFIIIYRKPKYYKPNIIFTKNGGVSTVVLARPIGKGGK